MGVWVTGRLWLALCGLDPRWSVWVKTARRIVLGFWVAWALVALPLWLWGSLFPSYDNPALLLGVIFSGLAAAAGLLYRMGRGRC